MTSTTTASTPVDSEEHKLDGEMDLLSFKMDPPLETIILDDESSLAWNPTYLSTAEADALFEHCLKSLNYEHSTYKIGEREVLIPRVQSWFADEGIVVAGIKILKTRLFIHFI